MKRVALAFALAACGGKQPTPTPATTTETGAHTEGSGSEHHAMPTELTKFHDILSPLWHAEKGAARTKDTCNAVPQLAFEADAIGKAVPPREANADTWTNATRALVAAVDDLKKVCESVQEAHFEKSFEAVHNAFHQVMEASGAHH